LSEGTSESARTTAANVPHAIPRASLRDNLESIALSILLVLVVRQLVVEAFKIPTGSMAPTLLGIHKEIRCPNCGWTFRAGHDKLGPTGTAECPNCRYKWPAGASTIGEAYQTEQISFRSPDWLWNEGRASPSGRPVTGMDAANRIDRWGTRIFVNKFIYRLRKPRRWEVIVFVYPYAHARCRACRWEGEVRSDVTRCPDPDCGSRQIVVTRKNYIKRLVGLPGERILITNGDVYVNGEIARKPAAIQARLWRHVLDSAYVPRKQVAPAWDFGPHADRWEESDTSGALRLDALDAAQPVMARFARPITDFCPYNGPDNGFAPTMFPSNRQEVGDCRLEVRLTVQKASAGAEATLRVQEDEHDFRVSLPVGGGEAKLFDNGELVLRAPVRLVPGVAARLAVENYDDLLVLEADGRVLMRPAYEGNPHPAQRARELAFGAQGAQAIFERVRIARDVHYLGLSGEDDGPRVYDLDDGSYFVLGDNTRQSSDSRFWPSPEVPAQNVMGEAFAVFWPIHDTALLSIGSR